MKFKLLPLLLAMPMICSGISCVQAQAWLGGLDGRADARRDMRAGRLVLETGGMPDTWKNIRASLWQERYGIEERFVMGCIVEARAGAHLTAYNKIMKAEIERRFGSGVLERTDEEALRRAPIED